MILSIDCQKNLGTFDPNFCYCHNSYVVKSDPFNTEPFVTKYFLTFPGDLKSQWNQEHLRKIYNIQEEELTQKKELNYQPYVECCSIL